MSEHFLVFYNMSCCPIPEKTEISIIDGVIFGAEEGVLALTEHRTLMARASREQKHVAKSSRLNPRPELIQKAYSNSKPGQNGGACTNVEQCKIFHNSP